ncbi:hypothetical protein P7C70_g3170, partial [Phenoliferia sp. Uapishka_3]
MIALDLSSGISALACWEHSRYVVPSPLVKRCTPPPSPSATASNPAQDFKALRGNFGALVDSDFEDFGGSPPPAPRRPREAFSPPAQQQVTVRPVVRSKRSAAKVQYHSDSSDDSERGDSAVSDAPLTTYEATLHRLHQSRMEPVAGRAALTGLALETYRMAQATRGFNKKLFKDTIAASQLPIHPRILEAIAKNEPFDFTCLNVTDALGEPEPLAVAALPGVFTAGKPPSRPIESGLQWAKAWGLYIAARRQWYAWEVPALEKFGEWFINRLDEKGYFDQYLAFFAERFPKRLSATSRIPALRRVEQRHRRRHQANQVEPSLETKFAYDGTKATSIIPAVAAMFALSVTQANTARTLVRNSEEWEKTNQGRGFEDEPKEPPLFPPNSEDHPSDCFPLAGTSSIPRLRRNLHFPVTTKPSSPSVDATLTDRPLPSVPSRVVNDPNINATLRARPDLFNVSSPIDIPRFKNLLATHPNRPLVDSVLHGLEFGFWPGHDGVFSKISHLSGPALRLNDKTLDFLAEHSNEDFEKGYLSESFDKLLPGMHVSPDYATDPINQRPRPINDLTASGLNDGVSKAMAKVRYDAQAELGAIARYRFRKGDLADPLADPVFWKSDVSGGFRNLPVSPYWQVKQVHRVRIRSGKKFVWVYRVDQRLMLGGRMSPRIFCTVMSLVLWATRREFALDYPIAFVDDTFGLDANGLRIPVTHYLTKETRLVCLEQAKVLTMWNYLHFPWSWTKQPMGKSLIIIRNVFSLVTANDGSISDMTISLAPESVELYATDVRNFLYRADGRPKLKEWLAIQGYSSWAVGVMHWGRFALECLYEKTAGKAFQWLPLSMNDVVRQDLNWFVKELREAPPLSLLDPALEHWGVNDAHIILHTDACLLTVDKKSSGLGFWTKLNGKRRHFSHRTKDRLNDIRWAEALAVFSAINWAIDNTDAKRIMIFTDSALCVYAFDAGKVALGPMHDLVWSVYARLAEKGIDLHLRHVSGEANKTADFLSRATNEKLIEKYGSSVSSFAPPTHLLGGPSR